MLILPAVRFHSVAAPSTAILGGSMSDSREDYAADSSGPDLNDGALRNLRTSVSNQQAGLYVPWYLPDVEVAHNCGLSGTELSIWDSGARPYGRTFAASAAAALDYVTGQFGTNDIYNGVSDAGTQASIRARVVGDTQEMIAAYVAAGVHFIWQTCIQRTAASYGAAATFKRDCCDQVNADLISWIGSTYTSTQVQVADLRAATTVGGVTSGAYADSAVIEDGAHPNQLGARRIGALIAARVRARFADRGLVPMHRASGPNLIAALNASTCGGSGGGTIAINCSVSAPDFSAVGGLPAVTYTVTPSGDGFFSTQIVADVGSSGGRTPANTFAASAKLKSQMFVTVDDGSGGVSAVNNVISLLYASFLTAGEQRIDNGALSAAAGSLAPGGVLQNARITTLARTMAAGSSDIGAPAFGSGLRLMPFVYFPSGAAPFRLRFVDPQIRAVT